MSLIAVTLVALLAQADAGRSLSAAQLEQRHIEAVQEIARLRTRLVTAKDRPALEQRIAALTAEADTMPARIAEARTVESKRRTTDQAAALIAAQQRALALAADPVYAVPALSAVICNAYGLRVDAKEAIRREQSYARRGGRVLDLALIHESQDLMREADDRERAARESLRRFKRQPQPCRGKVLIIATCAEDRTADGCDGVRDYLAAYGAL